MKPEIKLRAWHPKFGEMVYSNMDNEYQDKREWYPICFEIGFSHYPHSIMDDETIIMQYIGLKDKDGKEIYENDIVEFIYCPQSLNEKIIGQISRDQWGIPVVDNGKGLYHIENATKGKVIGNTLEMTELLNYK